MHKLKLLSQTIHISCPVQSGHRHCVAGLYVRFSNAMGWIDHTTFLPRFGANSIGNKSAFLRHYHCCTLTRFPRFSNGLEFVRCFSTTLRSTSPLRGIKPFAKADMKGRSSFNNRWKRKGRGQRQASQEREISKSATPDSKSSSLSHTIRPDHNKDAGRENLPSEPTTVDSARDSPGMATTRLVVSKGMGWDYETVDPATGKTPMDFVYDSHLKQIHQILRKPLPAMPLDGHINPDFFVGFAYYNYRLRDEYRAIIAQELQVPVQAVKLSVAWSGRFDVSRFNKVQKVCGVYLSRRVLPDTEPNSMATGAVQREADLQLPTLIQQRIEALVCAINARRTQHLLQAQFFQASGPIAEVEFALSRGEHRLLSHLREWLHNNILSRSLAVIVRGGNLEHYQDYERDHFEQAGQTSGVNFGSSRESLSSDGASWKDVKNPSTKAYEEWLAKETDEASRQQRFIDTKWLNLFHSRHIVPKQLSLRDLASLVTQALLRGEVDQVKGAFCSRRAPLMHEGVLPNDSSKEQQDGTASCAQRVEGSFGPTPLGDGVESDPDSTRLLSEDQVSLLCYCQEYLCSRGQSNQWLEGLKPVEGGGTPLHPPTVLNGPCLFSDEDFMHKLEPTLQPTALRWICTIRQALFLNDEGTSAGGGHNFSATAAIRLPALFVHSAYAGGLADIRYLKSNKAAMDALLRHPNDIIMKKAFTKRLRNGHQRLRIYEEISAS